MASTVKAFAAPAAPARCARRVSARASSAERPLWFPGMPSPSHLSGNMAGDFGFDPLGLGRQGEDRLKWCATEKLVLTYVKTQI